MPTLLEAPPPSPELPPTGERAAGVTRRFDRIGRTDVALVGGKGANLGEMTRAGLPVPPGFVVTVDAFAKAMDATGVLAKVREQLKNVDVDDPKALQTAAAAQQAVRAVAVPNDVRGEILAAYTELIGPFGDIPVAVRSSATVEDAPSASFAGMFESYLMVTGESELIERVRDCWASAFSARVLFYRAKQSLPLEMAVAVVVQRMIRSDKSGVMFTANPATHDTSCIVIEASRGLGEPVVQGQVTPDRYVLDKKALTVREMRVSTKSYVVSPNAEGGGFRREQTSDTARVLTDAELVALAELAIKVESLFGAPQDLEFAIDASGIYLTQTRPITTLTHPPETSQPAQRAGAASRQTLVRGLGASPGVATGAARVLADISAGAQLLKNEVLVAHMTSPDWVPLMRRASAIVTETGGMTSHAAIVSRELGVPCVVGTSDATRVLRDGMLVTVDGSSGRVFEGAVSKAEHPARIVASTPTRAPTTATRLYVNLGDPSQAESVAARDVDGVGLLRAEFMLLEALGGVHPKQLLAEGKRDEIVRKLVEPLTQIARAFHPRPVIYRAMDFRTNEFRSLRGGETHEPLEANPMIGYRGCYRYIQDRELFGVELLALYEARAASDNLHLMIPFVRTDWELKQCLDLVNRSPLRRSRGMQRWIMAEVPSVIWRLEDYAKLGVNAVSIGSNDLTQLILGVDRDNERLAALYDERDPAVLDAIREIIARSHQAGLTVSICGQAPSVHPEYAEFLVRRGIDSISVVPDAIERTRVNVARAEQRLLVESARRSP
ncbi:MAG: phosphoenolpyruvate synthase [Gemmatimonadaceae bacterium]